VTIRALIPTYKPGGLDARIHPHWKDAEIFTEVEFDENRVHSVKLHELTSDTLIIDIVKKEKIDVVIALSLSTRAVELLDKVGVPVLTGKIQTVKEAIKKFRNKKLYTVKITKIKQA